MVVTLTGANSFAMEQAIQALVDAHLSEHGDLSLERLDAETADAARIQEALTSPPFLAGRKLVVLRAPGANKQVQEQVEQLFGSLPETTDVIIIEPKLDKRLAYYKFLKKHTDFREFPELDAQALAHWLADTAKSGGGSISQADARYLVERAGANQQRLAGELDKLLLYNPQINRETIDLLIDATPQSTIFQLLESAFAGDAKRALELYTEQRAQNAEPSQIIAMLAWQLHVLALIKTAGDRSAGDTAKEAKLNPFVVQKNQAIARRLSLSQLKKLISGLLDIDKQTKRTSIDADEALQHYLLTIVRTNSIPLQHTEGRLAL